MKRDADQERRRKEVQEREELYANKIVPKNEQKLKFMDKLQDKYAEKREQKLDADELQKTAASQQFAAGILNDLNEQAAAKRKEMIAEKIRQDNLDKAQISAAMEKDDRLKDAEKKKEIERRRLGR